MAKAGFERAARWILRDTASILRHGRGAPRRSELIHVPTMRLTHGVNVRGVGAGEVRGGTWDLSARPIADTFHIKSAIEHWAHGTPWEDLGVFEHLVRRIEEAGRPIDGCSTRAEVVARYERLDHMFQQVAAEGRLRRPQEVDREKRRGQGALMVHVDRHRRPVFGFRGNHRLAAAMVLGLETVPARVGRVHPASLPSWRASLREPQKRRPAAADEDGLRTRLGSPQTEVQHSRHDETR